LASMCINGQIRIEINIIAWNDRIVKAYWWNIDKINWRNAWDSLSFWACCIITIEYSYNWLGNKYILKLFTTRN
jgi:hypothetical protein